MQESKSSWLAMHADPVIESLTYPAIFSRSLFVCLVEMPWRNVWPVILNRRRYLTFLGNGSSPRDRRLPPEVMTRLFSFMLKHYTSQGAFLLL